MVHLLWIEVRVQRRVEEYICIVVLWGSDAKIALKLRKIGPLVLG